MVSLPTSSRLHRKITKKQGFFPDMLNCNYFKRDQWVECLKI